MFSPWSLGRRLQPNGGTDVFRSVPTGFGPLRREGGATFGGYTLAVWSLGSQFGMPMGSRAASWRRGVVNVRKSPYLSHIFGPHGERWCSNANSGLSMSEHCATDWLHWLTDFLWIIVGSPSQAMFMMSITFHKPSCFPPKVCDFW